MGSGLLSVHVGQEGLIQILSRLLVVHVGKEFWVQSRQLVVDVGQEGLIQMLMATFVPQRRRPLHRAVPPVAAAVSTAIKHF